MVPERSLSKGVHESLISRIKVLARLRSDEKQKPHDGRFNFKSKSGTNGSADIRVSIIPTYWGENAVLRILSNRLGNRSLEELGFEKRAADAVRRTLSSSGMILCAGPTGSGKTSTLYALIRFLKSSQKSIITIEDPIEYAISGITQIQINNRYWFVICFRSSLNS